MGRRQLFQKATVSPLRFISNACVKVDGCLCLSGRFGINATFPGFTWQRGSRRSTEIGISICQAALEAMMGRSRTVSSTRQDLFLFVDFDRVLGGNA